MTSCGRNVWPRRRSAGSSATSSSCGSGTARPARRSTSGSSWTASSSRRWTTTKRPNRTRRSRSRRGRRRSPNEPDSTSLAIPDDPTVLSYLLSGIVQVELPRRQRLLEAATTVERLEELIALLDREVLLLSRRLRLFAPEARTMDGPAAASRRLFAEALFLPRIGVVVVAVALPEAELVVVEELEPADPLAALPEVALWHEQSKRIAVFELERLAAERVGQEHVVIVEDPERQVGGVALLGVRDDVGGARAGPGPSRGSPGSGRPPRSYRAWTSGSRSGCPC